MIQRAFITQWGTVVPWSSPRLVEQDLIICRALVSIYSGPFLKEHLAFRGGTALHKLYLEPQPRYSEDIDLVQVNAEPIKETIDHLREALSWLGEPVVKQKKHNNTLVFRVQPTDVGAGEIHLKGAFQCLPDGTATILSRERLVQRPVRSAHIRAGRAGRDESPRPLSAPQRP